MPALVEVVISSGRRGRRHRPTRGTRFHQVWSSLFTFWLYLLPDDCSAKPSILEHRERSTAVGRKDETRGVGPLRSRTERFGRGSWVESPRELLGHEVYFNLPQFATLFVHRCRISDNPLVSFLVDPPEVGRGGRLFWGPFRSFSKGNREERNAYFVSFVRGFSQSVGMLLGEGT